MMRCASALLVVIACLAILTTSQPVAASPQVPITYQCHSPSKSRDIFMRFNADGSWEIGGDAKNMKATGDVILFNKSGVATWTEKRGPYTQTNTFDKNTGVWVWDPGTPVEGPSRYTCKPV